MDIIYKFKKGSLNCFDQVKIAPKHPYLASIGSSLESQIVISKYFKNAVQILPKYILFSSIQKMILKIKMNKEKLSVYDGQGFMPSNKKCVTR